MSSNSEAISNAFKTYFTVAEQLGGAVQNFSPLMKTERKKRGRKKKGKRGKK